MPPHQSLLRLLLLAFLTNASSLAFSGISHITGMQRPFTRAKVHASSASLFDTTALKDCLAREYTGFFNPMEMEFYDEKVTFRDPLTTLNSIEAYKNNVDLLAGRTTLGAFLFRDAGIVLHSVEDIALGALRTRWTLEMTMKALPWQPTAYFSGVSDYTVDLERGVIVAQRDYWDSLNLGEGGEYEQKDLFSGLRDFLGQLSPDNPERCTRQAPGDQKREPRLGVLPYTLLRRGRGYDVRRYPATVVCARVAGDASGAQAPTKYGPLGAYLSGGENEEGATVMAYGPSITTTNAGAVGVTTDIPIVYEDSGPGKAPAPASSTDFVSLSELGWTSTVAVRRFRPGDPEGSGTPERLVDEHEKLLAALRRDGLTPTSDSASTFRRATYDASVTDNAPPEVWVPLEGHVW